MRILFEFRGGPLDGKKVIGQRGVESEAERYFMLTHDAKVGQRFRTASDYAIDTLAREELKDDMPHHFQRHVYRVVDRVEEGGDVFVRVEYVPEG